MFKKLFDVSSSNQKNIYASSNQYIFDLLNGDFEYSNNFVEFIRYYLEASPVFTATKLIADAASSIDIIIKDTKNDKIIYEHPALELLKNPNPFTDRKLFLKELFSYYILTGNSYLNIIGLGKPVELNVLTPAGISIHADTKDGYPQEYVYNQSSQSITFKRDAKKNFVSSNGNQLAHLRDFNPKYSSNNLVGVSMFAGVELEISQYILASIHNNSLLKNQGRPSGLLSFTGDETMMSEEQAVKIREEIQNRLTGAQNAGRPLFLSGKFTWQQLSESVKDMDFDTLLKSRANTIYSTVKIPLPMISPDNMTLSNLESSKYFFYDNAVLPIFKRVCAFLTKDVLSRYSNSQNLIFSFDESAIETLQARKTENTIRLYEKGLISLDEARTQIGYEQVSGGDTFYQPMNLVPIGSDNYTQDQRDVPKKSIEKAEYIRLMTSITDLNGKRLYDDDFIKKQVEIYYN